MQVARLPVAGQPKVAAPRPLISHRYVDNAWRPQMGATCPQLHNLRVLTWNMWFDPKYQKERTHALLRTIETHQPDIICLQEVTPPVLKIMCENSWVRANCFISDWQGYTVEPYGTAVLSRHPLHGLVQHPLPSKQGRSLLLAELRQANGEKFVFGNVHLESMKSSAAARQQQLEIIFPILKSYFPASVSLMGDFNFCSSWENENKNIDTAFTDIWPLLKGDAPGYSEDSTVNRMLAIKLRGTKKHVRFDRVLLASQRWSATSIELMGTSAVTEDLDDCFVSDHFGLLSSFAAREASS